MLFRSQMEDPTAAKGIVKRDIIKVVSPGTITEGGLIQAKKNNYLAAIFSDRRVFGLAYLDVSTGAFYATELSFTADSGELVNELGKIEPSEIIVNPMLYKQSALIQSLETRFGCMVGLSAAAHYEKAACERVIEDQFKVFALDSLGLKDHEAATRAAGALLAYVAESQKKVLGHINHLAYYRTEAYMLLDLSTRRNLELTETLRHGDKRGSLLWVLDQTATAMGGRLLRQWVEAPLINREKIEIRQNLVAELAANPGALPELKTLLTKIYDLERICGKISFGTVNPKDMLSLKQSLAMLPKLKAWISSVAAPDLQSRYSEADDLQDIFKLIDAGIADDAPFVLRDGGVIKTGYNAEIDRYREAHTKGKDWIRDLESAEREKTGIKSLKVKYNKV